MRIRFDVAQMRHDHAENFEHLDSFEFDVQHRPNSGHLWLRKGHLAGLCRCGRRLLLGYRSRGGP